MLSTCDSNQTWINRRRRPIVAHQKAAHALLQLLDTSRDLACMSVYVENADASSLSRDLLEVFRNLRDRSVIARER